ncbi:ParA family protein [Carnobacterium maltaromaticum]|uniref:ParA family protein n=1 Tax=Carnobacterium maltaromaticum TaxID=2751 RepID=UPI003AFA2EC1
MSKNGKVISIINMKGGVGKTALSVGISSFLSEDKDKKVLLIDSDPQFNATQAFISPDDYLKSEKTIFKLFKPQTELHQSFVMPTREELVTGVNSNLDILMGDLNLVLVNKSSDSGLIKRLKRFIDKNNLRDYYDYIIIDCPPTLTLYTDSALVSSDYYLIPNRIDRYSNIGISSLNRAIGDLIEQEDLQLECLGLIYTMVNDQLSEKQLEVKAELESSNAMENIYVFKSSTSVVNDMQVGKQGPIATRYSKSKKDITDVVDELQTLLSQNDVTEGETINGE